MINLFSKTQIIAVSNPKGGVGKSSTVLNVGAVMAKDYGLRVIIFDGEKDGSLSTFIANESIPAEHMPMIRDGYHMKSLQAEIPFYRPHADVILIDTAGITPDIGTAGSEEASKQERICLEAISLADLLIVPVNPSPIDLRKTVPFANTVDKYMLFRQGALKARLLINQAKTHQNLTKMVVDEMRNAFDHMPLFDASIRDTNDVKMAFGAGRSVIDYAPRSKVADDYRQLTKEIIDTLKAGE